MWFYFIVRMSLDSGDLNMCYPTNKFYVKKNPSFWGQNMSETKKHKTNQGFGGVVFI